MSCIYSIGEMEENGNRHYGIHTYEMIATAAVVRFIERIKITALVYYIVEKGYTEPTKEDMERCIDIVSKKIVNKWQ